MVRHGQEVRANKMYPAIMKMGLIWQLGFVMDRPKGWDDRKFTDMSHLEDEPWKIAQLWLEAFGCVNRCKHIHSYELAW